MWSYRINVWWDYVLREWDVRDQRSFWFLTINEFDAIVEGKRKRARAVLEDTAHFVRHIIANIPMRGKRAKVPKIEELIGMSYEQIVELEKMKRKAERKRQIAKAEREHAQREAERRR